MATDYELHDVIHITEHVKSVLRTADHINLLALNAILLAERAGRAAAGFGVVSASLRQLCQTLTRRMRLLDEISHALLADISLRYKDRRFAELMDRAGSDAALDAALDAAKRAQTARDADTLARLDTNARRLRREVDAARELCEQGLKMVNSAKIESVYGGDLAGQLMDVACAFAELMGRLLPDLKQLQRGARA